MSRLHLLSKSIPRAGHHYTVNVLRALYGENFFYCEFYQPLAGVCCKATPCLKRFRAPAEGDSDYLLSMQKSHDFVLSDKIYKTTADLKYLLFFRKFIDIVKSNVKLFLINKNSELVEKHGIDLRVLYNHHDKALYRNALAIIDQESPQISREDFDQFLVASASHYVKFTKKWVTVAQMKEISSLVIHYETLVQNEETDFCETLIRFIGIDPEHDVKDAILRAPRMTQQDRMADTSIVATVLLERFQSDIRRYDNLIERQLK